MLLLSVESKRDAIKDGSSVARLVDDFGSMAGGWFLMTEVDSLCLSEIIVNDSLIIQTNDIVCQANIICSL